jgi:hypothetical protein
MRRKAQITMEALLLYGVVFLVVVLAIAALAYFGVLDLGKYLPEKCNLESTGLFKCEEWQVQRDPGTVDVVVRNKGIKTIDITDASFVASDPGFADGCTTFTLDPIGMLLPGETQQVTIACTQMNVNVGKRLKGTVTISHGFAGGRLSSVTVGELIATVT